MGGRWSIEDEQLVPARWANVHIRRSRYGTRRPGARDRWEYRALPHTISVRATLRTHQRNGNTGDRTLGKRHSDRDGSAIGPVFVRNRKAWLCQSREKVRGIEGLNTVFFRVDAILWVGSRHHNTAVLHEDSFGVVETCDTGVGHDAEAGVDGLAGVI